jgi:elongation factor Ts
MPEVTPAMVKDLRTRTGAGIMDCKNALVECEGNSDKAVELIQKKGLSKAAKKAGAIAAEGAIHAYIHPGSKIGVLVEVNSQTDFVARSDDFREFVDLVGMQIASMGAEFVRRADVPESKVNHQREIFQAQLAEEDAQRGKSRPEQVIAKIIDGKIDKWLSESCLEEQPSILDNERTVGRIAEELTAKIGEAIRVRRFVRYELGEGIEKKKSDLAAEVAETLKAS